LILNNYHRISQERPVYVLRKSSVMLRNVDALLFDCDGVLIDTRESYDKAIVKTVTLLFEKILNIELLASSVTDSQIYLLRSTGGFNNDTDTAYILSLWLFTGLPDACINVISGLDAAMGEADNPRDLLELIAHRVTRRSGYLRKALAPSPQPLERIVSETIRRTGRQVLSVPDIEETLEMHAREKGILDLFRAFSRIISRPGTYGEGLLETVFSDLYYGPVNVTKIFGRGPYFDLGPGMYLNERLFIQEKTLHWLARRVGAEKLAIVSGRDRVSTEIVLGKLVKYFNLSASVFLSDDYRRLGERVKKPSPYGIMKAISKLKGASSPIFVGNSAEDFFMAQGVEEYGYKTLFCAVVGLAPDPQASAEFFASLGSDAILTTPDDLPQLLRGV